MTELEDPGIVETIETGRVLVVGSGTVEVSGTTVGELEITAEELKTSITELEGPGMVEMMETGRVVVVEVGTTIGVELGVTTGVTVGMTFEVAAVDVGRRTGVVEGVGETVALVPPRLVHSSD